MKLFQTSKENIEPPGNQSYNANAFQAELNRTEEQRPLRVSMENGKEFLIFPQDLLAPLYDHDFRLILIAAMRYAMGRNTYCPW